MSWIAVRKIRDDDKELIEKSAQKFAKRHNIKIADHQTAWSAVEEHVNWLEHNDNGYLRRLWEKCFARAVGVKGATGTAWGNIGYPAKS